MPRNLGLRIDLETCQHALGTLAVDDGRESTWYHNFYRATNITTIEPMIRLMVQQSNCFVITSIGNLRTDNRLSRITSKQRNSGEYRVGSKQHRGQRVAADYYLEPQIVINNSTLGQVAGSIGNLFNSALGLIGSTMDIKSSVVSLSLFDIRSTVQISASDGSATATNYGAALGFLGSKLGGSLHGYSATPEGKATVDAFLDSYNGMVRALKRYKAQDVDGGLGHGGTLKIN